MASTGGSSSPSGRSEPPVPAHRGAVVIRPEPLTEMVCVRMTAATKARLTREGSLQGRSNPDLGRIAIEQMLDAQDLHRMQEATR